MAPGSPPAVRTNCSPVQPLNTEPEEPSVAPSTRRVLGSTTPVSPLQPLKALFSIVLIFVLDRSSTPVRLHLKAAWLFIVVRLTAWEKSMATTLYLPRLSLEVTAPCFSFSLE